MDSCITNAYICCRRILASLRWQASRFARRATNPSERWYTIQASVIVNGVPLQYNAYLFSDGTINVGRINAIK